MASTASGIEYPTASDFIAPLNAHLQTLAETTQDALDDRAPSALTTYTPTFTGLTLGNGTVTAKYCKVGGVIVDEIVVTFGSTTAVTGSVIISGLQASNILSPLVSSSVNLHDAGSAYYLGAVSTPTATSLMVYAQTAGGSFVSLSPLNAGIPHTWATGDQIIVKTVRLAA